MTENLELGLQLLLVGMLSVFFILSIVIGLARLLIFLVNRLTPVDTSPEKDPSRIRNLKHIAALTASVDLITKGKGVIHTVKKI